MRWTFAFLVLCAVSSRDAGDIYEDREKVDDDGICRRGDGLSDPLLSDKGKATTRLQAF